LVRARQLQEDAARQQLASAERSARRAHEQAARDAERLESLTDTEPEHRSVAAFVAAAAALQACAAAHSAATVAAASADSVVDANREVLGDSAKRRMGAEELEERYVSAERAKAAARAQRDLDETAARVHRDQLGNAL
jgi:hypothetical protein